MLFTYFAKSSLINSKKYKNILCEVLFKDRKKGFIQSNFLSEN